MSLHTPQNGERPRSEQPELDVAATLRGKNIVLIGTTGFVGKVALSMLLHRYPDVGKVYALVRPGAGNTAEERFYRKVATSPAFDPLRAVHGDEFEPFLRSKIAAIPGDIGRPLCNFTDEMFDEFAAGGGIDVIINSAGLVSFMPSLESAIRINARGGTNVLEVARKLGAKLVHVSTCYVAGRREGEVWEDEEVVGYFPRRDELKDRDFSATAEIDDCQRIIDQVRDMASDRAHISEFRERAAENLEDQRRDADDDRTMRLAVARERKIWVTTKLTELGQERAEHWGWTNTYTYTKSLGEQAILADTEVVSTIVRPAIVESSVRYPFPGWCEGFNTTAPLVYLVIKGQRLIPAAQKPLDIVPVDLVCAGMIMATAAILADQHEPVYQLCTSDSNPVTAKRIVQLSGLAVRRHFRELADAGEKPLENRLRSRLECYPVHFDDFQRRSAPRFGALANRIVDTIERRLPRWGAPRLTAWAERAKDELAKVSNFTEQVDALVTMFRPFNHDIDITFRADNIRALHARLTAADREALSWDPENIDWRHYWMDTHFVGLQKWVFPVLDDEFGPKARSVYTYKDLNELFDSATKLHSNRVAFRVLLTEEDDAEPLVYTYERVQDMAQQGAASLRQYGIEHDDRVVIMSENRPEWGISYFAILKAGGTAVPVDHTLSLAELCNILRASGSKIAIMSPKVVDRILEDEKLEAAEGAELSTLQSAVAERGPSAQLYEFEHVLVEPKVSPGAIAPPRKGDAVASLIYTSGTTGDPKGVMLTHKNLTSMAAKLSTVFKLYRHDSLLSVLPLHHTFEFSAGFLMPLIHGSSITYLDEINADSLSTAFEEGTITGMVGVPALWQLLHRKIYKQVADRGPLVRKAFDAIVDLNRSLRDKAPFGGNLGKVLFYPVHRKLGGRMRLLISGGSALPADVMESFQGLGFRLFEGYGMTESSPVLTVTRPGDKLAIGSVGRALPGVDVQIFEPDERGVGEVIAKGPNVMKGYYENADATDAVLRAGWLHTGDLGRLDEDGNLFIVGRKKEMILGTSGENVYPDELEEVYRDTPYIKELSVVGLPHADGGETVAMLIVPDYEYDDDMVRDRVRDKVREHVRDVSKTLPLYKRAKVVHLWDFDLPKTSTRKIKRREVVDELERLERAARGATAAVKEAASGGDASSASWVRDVIAQVAQKKRAAVTAESLLDELGFDSLMFTELGVAIEAAGIELPDPGELSNFETVADVETYIERHGGAKPARGRGSAAVEDDDDDEIHVPAPLVSAGRRVLRFGQRMTYERLMQTDVYGGAFVPPFGGYIIAANHSSHLDMGLVKHALGEYGDDLVALAAKDYFFDDPVRRMYFENFTNLVPMERYGSLRESLRIAGDVVRQGEILLIFPEGTRSTTGVMVDFKASLGYLAMHNKCGILPMYLAGTHDAMPKGAFLPKQRDIAAHIGPFIDYPQLVAMTEGATRAESYRRIATNVERVVRKLCPAELEWTLGASGRTPVAEWEDHGDDAAATAESAPSSSSPSASTDTEVRS